MSDDKVSDLTTSDDAAPSWLTDGGGLGTSGSSIGSSSVQPSPAVVRLPSAAPSEGEEPAWLLHAGSRAEIDLEGGDSPSKQHLSMGGQAQQRLLDVKAELQDDNEYLHLNEGYMLQDAQASKAKLAQIVAWAKGRSEEGALSSKLFHEINQIIGAPVRAQHD